MSSDNEEDTAPPWLAKMLDGLQQQHRQDLQDQQEQHRRDFNLFRSEQCSLWAGPAHGPWAGLPMGLGWAGIFRKRMGFGGPGLEC